MNLHTKQQWTDDITALIQGTGSFGNILWATIKNLAIHDMVEQLVLDPKRTEFTINVCPIGLVTLHREGTEWQVTNVNLSKDFVSSLNVAMKNKESPLIVNLSDGMKSYLKRSLESYIKY